MTYHAARLLFMSALLALSAGCGASRGQQLYAAKMTYDGALTGVNQLFREGVITDPDTARAIKAAKDEVHDGLADAERRFNAGDNLGFDFVMIRLRSSLDRFIRFKTRIRPLTPPQTPNLEPIPPPAPANGGT